MVMSELISWQQRENETDATICWHIHQYMTSVTLYSGHDDYDDDDDDDLYIIGAVCMYVCL